MKCIKTAFGQLTDGRPVSLYTLTNDHGMRVCISDFGAIITALYVPDQHGVSANVVLGVDNLDDYINDRNYFGAVIGRYANRIRQGCFELDGVRTQLEQNDGPHHLHGGTHGFHKVLWQSTRVEKSDSVGVVLNYVSVDGDGGYPGNLDVTVTYQLSQDNCLQVQYQASTDKATPVNLTQHSYFNLAAGGDILQHRLHINADSFTPVDAGLLPISGHQSVADTVFDFRAATTIGARINDVDAQLAVGRGYDHNYVLNKTQPGQLSLAARVLEPVTGRVLELLTDEPGLQFYSGNFLDGSCMGRDGAIGYRNGFCLEPQHFPDSPNCLAFPSSILRPGQLYTSRSQYRFNP